MRPLPSFEPTLKEFPLDIVLEEAQIRENYLSKAYLPSIIEQREKIDTAIELMAFNKIGAYGKGRSGGSGRGFISELKTIAKYNGRIVNGKERPMAQYIEDLTVTRFPEGLSALVYLSGRGTTADVVRKVMGCLELGIPSICLSYNPNSPIYKMAKVSIFIPQKLKENRIYNPNVPVDLHSPLDVLGNSFETATDITLRGVVAGLKKFHEQESIKDGSRKTLEYVESAVEYVQHLNRQLISKKDEISELGVALSTVPHVRMTAAGEGVASFLMATNRIGHTGRIGINQRSIDVIRLEDVGPPGFLDIEKGDAVILSSASLKTSHTIYVGQEATNADADIYLLTSERSEKILPQWLEKYKIKQPKLVIALPFSLPDCDIRFYDIGLRHLLEYTCSGVARYLGLTTEDIEWFHIQRELE